MKYYDPEYQARAKAAGYEDLLAYTLLYIGKEAPGLIEKKPLPKSKKPSRQQKPKHRTSKISEEVRGKIIFMGFQMIPCRQIAAKLREEDNISIHYSTVNKIINYKYKPKA